MSVAWGAAMISAVGQVLLIVLYTSVMLCALIGNSVVCWTVVSSRRMHCVINYFLVNLAVSDIMMAVLCIPFNFVANVLLHNWPFGAVLCPLVSYSQVVSVLLSAFTLLAISLDRYRAILFPMRPRLSTRAAAVVIGSIWTLALVVSLPVAVLSRLRSTNQSNSVRCDEAWPKETHRYIYSIVVMVMQYFLPLSVLVFTYTRIAIYIWAARAPGEALDHRDQRMAASKRKVIIITTITTTTTPPHHHYHTNTPPLPHHHHHYHTTTTTPSHYHYHTITTTTTTIHYYYNK